MHIRDRGKHSWGFTDGERIVKREGDIAQTFDPSVMGSATTLLHTRFATFGEKTADNSHPFRIGRILGVHNGMLYNHSSIAEKRGIEYKVDSELIFHYLNEGWDLSELDGYGAIVFFEDGVLHISRFKRGDMILVKCSWGWLWASTADAVNHALTLSGLLDTFEYQVNLKEGKLYQLRGDQIAKDQRRITIGTGKYTSSVTSTPATVYNDSRWWRSDYSKDSGWKDGVDQLWDRHHNRWIDDPAPDNKLAHKSFIDSKGIVWTWDKAKGLYQHADPQPEPPKQLPLPTAETSTFNQTNDEPTSDYDEIVDQGDDSRDDDGFADARCWWCNEYLVGQFVSMNVPGAATKETVCIDCFDTVKDEYMDDVRDELQFAEWMADEAEKQWGYSICQCEDCNEWTWGADRIWVDSESKISLCDRCYQRNESNDWVEEGEDQTATASAPVPA